MGVFFKILSCLCLVLMTNMNMQGQTSPAQSPTISKNSTSKQADCETVIGSIDMALSKATKARSNVVVLVKSKRDAPISLNRARSKGLTRYFEQRGFSNFEVAVDLISNVSDRVDIFVDGQLLFSLPIARKDNLDFTPCVIG